MYTQTGDVSNRDTTDVAIRMSVMDLFPVARCKRILTSLRQGIPDVLSETGSLSGQAQWTEAKHVSSPTMSSHAQTRLKKLAILLTNDAEETEGCLARVRWVQGAAL